VILEKPGRGAAQADPLFELVDALPLHHGAEEAVAVERGKGAPIRDLRDGDSPVRIGVDELSYLP
jgi:hypothetical protein